MKKIFNVFLRDLRSISKNIAAIIIIAGLCTLPSLYAWINIKACWNPYANTSNLPIAVSNDDEGAVFNGTKVNVGNEIINDLKKNKDIHWIFVDTWQGNYGLNEGKYYALIEIPNDFSRDLISLTTTTPEKPDIIYKDNEKLNAIASKITNEATSELADKAKDSFVAAVNKEALDILNPVGGNLDNEKSKILQLNDTITQAISDIGDIRGVITEANGNSESLQNYLNDVKSTLPKITEQINSLQNAVEASKDLVLTTKQSISTTASDINNDIIQLETINQEFQTLLSTLKDVNNNLDSSDAVNIINQLISICNSSNNIIDADIGNLESMNRNYPNSNITNLINLLQAVKGLTADEETRLNTLKTLIQNDTVKTSVNSTIDSISALSNEISNDVVQVSNEFYNVDLNILNNTADNLSTGLDNADSILESTRVIVPQLNALADYGIASSKVSVQEADDLNNKLENLQNELNILSSKMTGLNEKNLDDIINLMKMNPNKVADFLSSPIDVKEEDIYNMSTFGIGLTPFYTVLAIWVGALLASSLLTVECEEVKDKNGKNIEMTLLQKHFGKLLLFICISIIQATIVTLGDKYILGVNPANMPLMMGFAIFSGITFTVIIFTLVSIFGNVGKAIAVVIMVFQIAGSGGIYPIQTNPKIFGILEPLWPFTYAIGGFREAIAGPIWTKVGIYAAVLFAFIIVFLSLSILKKPFHKLTEFMEHKFKEAGI